MVAHLQSQTHQELLNWIGSIRPTGIKAKIVYNIWFLRDSNRYLTIYSKLQCNVKNVTNNKKSGVQVIISPKGYAWNIFPTLFYLSKKDTFETGNVFYFTSKVIFVLEILKY